MSEEKELLEKIAKIVGLSKGDIELATFAEPKAQISKAQKLNSEVKSIADEIFKIKQKGTKTAQKNVGLSERIVSELMSDKSEFESKVKELGINPSSLPQIKEYDKAINQAEDYSKNIKKMSKDILS